MTPELFRTVGEALYGPAWHGEISRTLNVSLRRVRRWAAGEYEIPDGLLGELANVCERHSDALRELSRMLRMQAKAAERAAALATTRLREE